MDSVIICNSISSTECRTCLGKFNLSESVNVRNKIDEEKSILEAIELIASIQRIGNSQHIIPQYICNNCLKLLKLTLAFRLKILTSYVELEKRIHFLNNDPLCVTLSCEEEEKKVVFDKKPAKKVLRRIVRRKNKNHKLSSSDSPSDFNNITNKRDRTNNAAEEDPRLCSICGKLFKAKPNFNSHMTTVHRKRPSSSSSDKSAKISFLCPDCGRVISGTRQNFVAHRRYHHSEQAQVKKRFQCNQCPRKFYREKNLIIHQRIHKGEKGYVCEICPDKSYTQIGGLILHKRKVHLRMPTFTCNYCGKQFFEKHYLETHIRQWHTGERPFSCEICGKAFSCNGTLLRHRKDSHGEKKPCPKCGKMYTEGELRKHLKRHKIREEGIKRKKYTCEYCDTEMNFTSRKRHLLKQHGIMLRGRGEDAERVPIINR